MALGANSGNYYSALEHLDDPPSPKRKKNKPRAIPLLEAFPELDYKSNPDNDAKYIIISAVEENKKLTSYDPFIITKAIKGISSQILRASFLKEGDVLILCKNNNIAKLFLKQSSLANIPVKVEYHKTLNNTKGVIYCPLLINLSNERIAEALAEDHVVEARHISRITSSGPINTGNIVLTFNRYELPQSIVCFQKIKIREYIPNPMRCRNCQLIGHTQKFCKSLAAKCCKCNNLQNHQGNCEPLYCFNCKVEGHGSDDSKCPSFLAEKEILKIQTRTKCSRYMARKTYYSSKPLTLSAQDTNYAQVAKSAAQSGSSNSTSHEKVNEKDVNSPACPVTAASTIPTTTTQIQTSPILSFNPLNPKTTNSSDQITHTSIHSSITSISNTSSLNPTLPNPVSDTAVAQKAVSISSPPSQVSNNNTNSQTTNSTTCTQSNNPNSLPKTQLNTTNPSATTQNINSNTDKNNIIASAKNETDATQNSNSNLTPCSSKSSSSYKKPSTPRRSHSSTYLSSPLKAARDSRRRRSRY